MAVPDSPPCLLTGRTAYHWNLVFIWAGVGACLALVLMIPSSMLAEPLRPILVLFEGAAGMGCAAVVAYATMQRYHAEVREQKAGYTTLGGRPPHLWLLHHKTGEVVRRPSERRSSRHRPP
jgi:hypothetical protein